MNGLASLVSYAKRSITMNETREDLINQLNTLYDNTINQSVLKEMTLEQLSEAVRQRQEQLRWQARAIYDSWIDMYPDGHEFPQYIER